MRELTGIEPHAAAHGLSLIVDDAASVLPALLPLTQDGVEVRVSRPTLEDVFVEVTGRDQEQPAA